MPVVILQDPTFAAIVGVDTRSKTSLSAKVQLDDRHLHAELPKSTYQCSPSRT